jgi:2-polyprenyl-3-methyl-5-hydroxy-6-metoxy-1,4-benzoquinol methylase
MMATVSEHYDRHLGPIYSWMIGDAAGAMERSREELRALGIRPGPTGTAVDLGAGPGLHAIPLAELGFSVLAIDACGPLIAELRQRARSLPIRALEGDLQQFRRHLDGPVDAILCMGDTLTHLPSREAIEALLDEAAASLAHPGVFIATFRDYATQPLEGIDRFIPVRSDTARTLTCFLEYGDETVTVYDLLHERTDTGTEFTVSSYPKLRLSPGWVAGVLTALGLSVQQESAPSRMVRIVARRD